MFPSSVPLTEKQICGHAEWAKARNISVSKYCVIIFKRFIPTCTFIYMTLQCSVDYPDPFGHIVYAGILFSPDLWCLVF